MTMLMRFDPFRDLDNVTQMLSRTALRLPSMPMDAYRDNDRFVVHFDLPGVDPGSIDLTVEKNVLTVTAERKWEPTQNQEVLISERPQGVFTRQLFLGDSLDPDQLQASYDQGVLTIVLPVAEQAKPRKVEVSSTAPSRTISASSTQDESVQSEAGEVRTSQSVSATQPQVAANRGA
jgi:HSP20 family protein